MKLLLSLALLALVHVLPAPAQAQPAGFQPPPLFEPPLPTRAAPTPAGLTGDVAYLPDISFKTVPGYRPLKLDLYLPPADGKDHPIVVWIHGGGFEIGNPRADWTWGDWRPVLARLAARGYLVAGVSYRLSSEAPFPAALEDVQDAVRFLRRHAGLWQGDASRVLAWGLSAGGALAALAGTNCPAADATACVQGVVDWFGPMRFDAQHLAQPSIRRFFNCTADAANTANTACAAPAQASALQQVRPGLPPFLIVHGGGDPLVPAAHSTRMGQALSTAGVPNRVLIHPGLGHGFMGATPAQLEQILQATFDGMGGLLQATRTTSP